MHHRGKAYERDPYHDILLHCDVHKGERPSVDKDVAYSEETGLDEMMEPDFSRYLSVRVIKISSPLQHRGGERTFVMC